MAKGMDSKKAAKKKPAKTADEKRADKKTKKSEVGLFGHWLIQQKPYFRAFAFIACASLL